MSTIEIKVPNIGDFKEVEIIEIMVKPGDTIKADQSLITVESDKASMEIPSSAAGVVKELKVKVGDKVGEGSLLLMLDEAAGGATCCAGSRASGCACCCRSGACAPAAPHRAAAPAAGSFGGKADIECDMMVLGAGPGGYSAAFRAADLGMNTVLIERYATLGGVCLNVGCIPSKALLHVAAVIDETATMSKHGISFAKPAIDIDQLRGWKEKVVGKMTGGLSGMAKARKVNVVQGVGQFLGPNHIEVTAGDGSKKVIAFKQAIIAAGSSVGEAALRAGRSPHRRFDGRAGTARDPEENAGHRRRHHRPGNGDGVLDPGRPHRRGRDDGRPDAGRRPRHGQGLAKVQRSALRQDHDRRPRPSASKPCPKASRSPLPPRKRAPPRRSRSSTTWCWWPSAAARTAARSPPTRPA